MDGYWFSTGVETSVSNSQLEIHPIRLLPMHVTVHQRFFVSWSEENFGPNVGIHTWTGVIGLVPGVQRTGTCVILMSVAFHEWQIVKLCTLHLQSCASWFRDLTKLWCFPLVLVVFTLISFLCRLYLVYLFIHEDSSRTRSWALPNLGYWLDLRNHKSP